MENTIWRSPIFALQETEFSLSAPPKREKSNSTKFSTGKKKKRRPKEKWEESLKQLTSYRGGVLLGISSDCGGGILRGANWGPLFIRNQLYSQANPPKVFDLGDVRVIPHLLMDQYLNQQTIDRCRKALYGNCDNDLPVSPLSITMDLVEKFYQQFSDKGLIGLGGDHSVSFPLTRPLLRRRKAQGRQMAIIHFDAHTDMMESRLGIDICFGSWAYHILDDLPSPEHLYQIGLRNSAHDKEYWSKKFPIQQFWSSDVQDRGGEEIAEEIIKDLKKKHVDELYVSFDIDAIDLSRASATGTPEPNGLSPDVAMVILQKLERQFPVTAADMVEVAPFIRHHDHRCGVEPDSTLTIAEDFVRFFISALNRAHGA